MTKEDQKWLKENAPWDYDALYGDPTGVGGDNSGCGEILLISILAVGLGFLLFYLFGAK